MPRPSLALILLVTLAACGPQRRDTGPGDGGTFDRPTCTVDDECDSGRCQEGRCAGACLDDEDCPGGICVALACVAGTRCSPSGGAVAFGCFCQSDSDCHSNRCTDGSCDAKVVEANAYETASFHRGLLGTRLAYDCPPDARDGSVWGTDVYTSDSLICTAAVHAGRFTRAEGGRVEIEIWPGLDAYRGSTRHGVTTSSYGSYSSSFAVLPLSGCLDGKKSEDESDVDCGPGCGPCQTGRTCTDHVDCQSGLCHDGRCEAPLCGNGRLDEGESDVDCGGDCPRCEVGRVCDDGTDCDTGNCEDGVCAMALCANERQDEGESDVDCGGDCLRCDLGKQCNGASDCASGECRDGRCAVPYCSDGIKGQAETDIDCGGGTCARCKGGQACLVEGDCTTGRCEEGVCGVPACDNGHQDGLETGVDCGGAVCAPCEIGGSCTVDEDCASRTCTARVCAEATACVNGVHDDNESDVDCGGACQPCGSDKFCNGHRDCAARNSCEGSVCAITEANANTSLAFESLATGQRTIIYCPRGLTARTVWGVDVFTSDSSICTAAVHAGLHTFESGGAVTVESRGRQISFGGSEANGVTTSSYGSYSTSYAFVPPGPCANGVKDSDESWVDCGGATCARCGAGAECVSNGDCVSDRCVQGHCTE